MVSRTIGELIPGVVTQRVDEPHVAQLKGERRMAKAIANAVAARERVPSQLPAITVNGVSVPLRTSDFETAIADARRTRQPHNKARETFVSSMLSMVRTRVVEELDYTPEQAELNDIMAQLRMNDKLRVTLNLAWLPMDGRWLLDQLFSKPAQLRRFAPWLSDAQVSMLTRPKGAPLTLSDIPLLDEALELLGPDPHEQARQASRDAQRAEEERYAQETLAQAGIGSGIVSSKMLADHMRGDSSELVAQRAAADREWTYGHIVVDEAQELTAMDWRMLIRRCPSRSFTIVGDVAQTSALGGTRDWRTSMNALFGPRNWSLNELTINYRNPREVSDLAARFAEGEGLYISTVKAIRSVPDSVQRVSVADRAALYAEVAEQTLDLAGSYLVGDGTGRVAVIVPDELRDAVQAAVHEAVAHSTLARSGVRFDEQIMVCGAQSVKGLEYDAVMVVEPGLIEQEAPTRLSAASDLYVALTRPTQRLLIVRTQADETLLDL